MYLLSLLQGAPCSADYRASSALADLASLNTFCLFEHAPALDSGLRSVSMTKTTMGWGRAKPSSR